MLCHQQQVTKATKASLIHSFADEKWMSNINYDPNWKSKTPSGLSSTDPVTIGPDMSVASFINTVLKSRYGANANIDVNAHAMVINDLIAFPASEARNLGKMLQDYNKGLFVRLRVSPKIVNVKLNRGYAPLGNCDVDITQTFGQQKKQLEKVSKLDLTRYQVMCISYELTDNTLLGFIQPYVADVFNFTERPDQNLRIEG